MANVILKKMEKEDIEGVYNVGKLSLKESWSLDSIEKELSNKFATYIICKINNEVIGFAGAWIIACEGQITNVAVHPNFRGQGISKKLMETLLLDLEKNNCKDITLEVRESNEIAINLYKQFGFISEGLRKNFYENPKEAANIMWLHK